MMTVQCCKCNRIQVGEDWIDRLEPPEGPVSHTYCPICYLEARIEFFTAEASQMAFARAAFVGEVLRGAVGA